MRSTARHAGPSQMEAFIASSTAAAKVVETKAAGYDVLGDPRPAVTQYVSLRKINEGTFPSLAALVREIADQVMEYGSLAKIPAAAVGNTRNDMYLASEAIRFLMKDKENDLTKEDVATLNAYKGSLDNATKLHPALGQGRGRDRARPRHHDRLEAHRRHRRREDRQEPPDLCAGRLGRARRRRHDRRGRQLRPAGVDHARAVLGRCRHHGGKRLRPADGRRCATSLMAWVLTLPAAMMLSDSSIGCSVNCSKAQSHVAL